MHHQKIGSLWLGVVVVCGSLFQLRCGVSPPTVSEADGGRAHTGGEASTGGQAPSGGSGAGGAQGNCASLSEAECTKSNCHAMTANRVDDSGPEASCWFGGSVFVGCRELGCPASVPVARDPDGNLWRFFSGCVPEGWVIQGAISASEECAPSGGGGEGGEGGLPGFGGQGGSP